MLKLSALLKAIARYPDAGVEIQLPSGEKVPPHFHVTEVGLVSKKFIDCGGTVRSWDRCVLQIWVAADTDHRVQAGKLGRIIHSADSILGNTDWEVEVEYDVGVITQMKAIDVAATADGIIIRLDGKHTACLAPDRCGVQDSTCLTPGCCAPVASETVAINSHR